MLCIEDESAGDRGSALPETVENIQENAPDQTDTSPELVPEDAPNAPTGDTPKDDAPPDAPEPITFDVAAEDFAEKVKTTIEGYDLDPPLQAAVTALQEAVQNRPATPIDEYLVYGEPETIKASLDRDSLLTTSRREEDGDRPNTDKYIETLPEETATHLTYDLMRRPSQRYEGYNSFQELIADTLALDGDTVPVVIDRFNRFVTAMKADAFVAESDVPSYIPPELIPAYKSLDKLSQRDYQALSPEYDRDDPESKAEDEAKRASQLKTLGQIQRGIEADTREKQELYQTSQQAITNLNSDIVQKETSFYTTFRDQYAEKMAEIQFSPDANLNQLLASQQITLLRDAFFEGPDGDFARKALKTSGVNFDFNKAIELQNNVTEAATNLSKEERALDKNGKPLNPINLNKAKANFVEVGRQWTKFASDLLEQEKRLVLGKTEKAIEGAIEKKKVAPKARGAIAGAASSVTHQDEVPAFGTPAYNKYWAQKTIEEQARKAKIYQ